MGTATIVDADKEEQTSTTVLLQQKNHTKKSYLILKRCMDVVLSLFGGLICFVPMLLIAVWVRIDSPGPAIFKQQRIGRNGEAFFMYKFRSMSTEAPNAMAARDFVDSNRYITKAGKILRRTSLDELPQLLNILKGDMSLVGYRPVCVTEVELNEKRAANGVFEIRPGLTGLAQVCGRDDLDVDQKVVFDTQYAKNCTLKMDIWCVFKTVAVVFTGKGNI